MELVISYKKSENCFLETKELEDIAPSIKVKKNGLMKLDICCLKCKAIYCLLI